MTILIIMIIILFIALFIEGITQYERGCIEAAEYIANHTGDINTDIYIKGYKDGCRDTLLGIREDMK